MTEVTLIYVLKGVPLQENFEEFITNDVIHKRTIHFDFSGISGDIINLDKIPKCYHHLTEMSNMYRYIFTLKEAFFS